MQNIENKRLILSLCARSLSLKELQAKSREHGSYRGPPRVNSSDLGPGATPDGSARCPPWVPRVRHWNAHGSAIAWLRLSKTSYYPGDNIVKLVLSHLKHQSTKNRKRVPDGLSTALDRGIFLVTESLRSEFPPLRVHQNHGGFNLAFEYAPIFLEELVLLLRTN